MWWVTGESLVFCVCQSFPCFEGNYVSNIIQGNHGLDLPQCRFAKVYYTVYNMAREMIFAHRYQSVFNVRCDDYKHTLHRFELCMIFLYITQSCHFLRPVLWRGRMWKKFFSNVPDQFLPRSTQVQYILSLYNIYRFCRVHVHVIRSAGISFVLFVQCQIFWPK